MYPCMVCVALVMCLLVLCVECLTASVCELFGERLSAPSICFVCVFCMSEVISSFRSLRAGSQMFALLILMLTYATGICKFIT